MPPRKQPGRVQFGDRVRDRVSGFEGIVVSSYDNITGCLQFGVTPAVNEKGETGETKFFDEVRLEVIISAAVKFDHPEAERELAHSPGPDVQTEFLRELGPST